MKRIIPLVILLFVITAGCTSSSNKNNPDKQFYDKFLSKNDAINESMGSLDAGFKVNDTNQVYHAASVLEKEYLDFYSELEEMPVSEKMLDVKKECILGLKSDKSAFYQLKALMMDDGNLKQMNDLKKTDFDLVIELFQEGDSHYSNAEKLYDAIYPLNTPATVTSSKGYEIQIKYSGSWQGNYGDTSGQQSINGYGDEKFSIDSPKGPIVAVIQKYDTGDDALIVEIIKDGKVMKSGHTTSSFGIVTVSYNPGWLG